MTDKIFVIKLGGSIIFPKLGYINTNYLEQLKRILQEYINQGSRFILIIGGGTICRWYQDYAKKYLAECVASVKKQDYAGEMKIFIVDNETSKESYACIKNIIETPYRGGASLRTQIIRNKNNDGFAKGNNDAIKLALEQGFDYIILFNMDTVVETDCIRKMVEAIKISNFQFLISNKIQNS